MIRAPRRRPGAGLALAVALGCAGAALGCAPALRPPAPLPPAPPGGDAGDLLARADRAWAARADPARAREAARLYRDAAAADERRVDGLLGAMAALGWLADREPAAARAGLADEAVQLGQWCQRRAPAEPACDYRLAVSLGLLARERHATAHEALGRMVTLLRRAAAAAPGLDDGGPRRVLALLLLRAPGWPVGPGDPEGALEEARAAAALAPGAAPNQLALGEALQKNERPDEARAAYRRAADLARTAEAAGIPEAPGWRAEAERALGEGGGT